MTLSVSNWGTKESVGVWCLDPFKGDFNEHSWRGSKGPPGHQVGASSPFNNETENSAKPAAISYTLTSDQLLQIIV